MTLNKKNQTFLLTKEQALKEQRWLILDAKGKCLGRLSSEIAKILRGKHKPTFTPHMDSGDGVIVINAEGVAVTGSKDAQKIYRYYTGWIGGLREIPFRIMQARKPDYIIRHAVKGMMPKTRQGKAQLKRLRIFKGTEHGLQAQQPVVVNI